MLFLQLVDQNVLVLTLNYNDIPTMTWPICTKISRSCPVKSKKISFSACATIAYLAVTYIKLHAPTNSTQKFSLIGRSGQFTYTIF
jgi:hypothetical protein